MLLFKKLVKNSLCLPHKCLYHLHNLWTVGMRWGRKESCSASVFILTTRLRAAERWDGELICLKKCISRVWRAKDTWVSYLLGEALHKKERSWGFWKGGSCHTDSCRVGDPSLGMNCRKAGAEESYNGQGRGGISGVKGENERPQHWEVSQNIRQKY